MTTTYMAPGFVFPCAGPLGIAQCFTETFHPYVAPGCALQGARCTDTFVRGALSGMQPLVDPSGEVLVPEGSFWRR